MVSARASPAAGATCVAQPSPAPDGCGWFYQRGPLSITSCTRFARRAALSMHVSSAVAFGAGVPM
eukprot:9384661-Lingulodinium_polyedra.AAC.1